MNIFEFAKQMEKDGETFYRELAASVQDKGLKKILTELADDEVKHFQILTKMEANSQVELTDSTVLQDAKNIFAEMKEQGAAVSPDISQVELYRKAQSLEKKSEDFYREKAEAEEMAAHREVLLKIADEELRHYHLLDSLIEFVNRPHTWLENAEFNHLTEY